MKINRLIYATVLCALLIVAGCKKEDSFLDTKPNQALNIPTTLNALQLLIGNEDIFNRFYPALGQASTDDMVLSPSLWASDFPSDRNAYVWAKDIYSPGEQVADWNNPYRIVYYANTILTVLPTISITGGQQRQADVIKGSALFFRSIAFHNLIQHFALPYNPSSAERDLGVPLPLSTDLKARTPRSSLKDCFDRITSDLNSAASLLPDLPATKTLPSKAAVYGLLSRIYLIMGNYEQSLSYSNQYLKLFSQLQDFNKLNPAAFPVFPNFSPEEVFHAGMTGLTTNGFSAEVDNDLFRSFTDKNDLRPAIFFYNDRGKIGFNSQFNKKNDISTGISTAEIYLTRAECEARLNNPADALKDLNTLLITRWKTATFKPFVATSPEDVLPLILNERRKELVMTGIRWSDLRRLNQDPRFATTLSRNINGTIYSISPNSPRYALPIPETEFNLNPIPQNPR